MKAGYYNPQHQGWKAFRLFKMMKPLAKKFDAPDPYPTGSTAWKEYHLGLAYALEGRTWDGRSTVEETREPDRTYR